MALMLGGALRVILLFMNYALTFRIEGEKTGQFWIIVKGVIISLLVVIINCFMRLVVIILQFRSKPSPMQSDTTRIQSTKVRLFSTTPSSISSMHAASSTSPTNKTPNKTSSCFWRTSIWWCWPMPSPNHSSNYSIRSCGFARSEDAISQNSSPKTTRTRRSMSTVRGKGTR